MTIDWMNPSGDVIEAKRIGYEEGLAERDEDLAEVQAENERLRAALRDIGGARARHWEGSR